MKIEQKCYEFLTEIERGAFAQLTEKDLGVTEEEYFNVLENLAAEELISGLGGSVPILGLTFKSYKIDRVRITLKGRQYLKENSVAGKTIKVLKEVVSMKK